MIAFLEGTVAGKTLTSAYVNVGGVGFEVGMSSTALAKLPEYEGKLIVALLPDSGDRYYSTPLFTE